MAQVVIIRRGPNGGPKVERTVTDPEKIEQLLKLAETVRQSDKTRMISWSADVAVTTVELPNRPAPVGIFTAGVLEVWGDRTLRVPGKTSLSFFARDSSTDKVAQLVSALWDEAAPAPA